MHDSPGWMMHLHACLAHDAEDAVPSHNATAFWQGDAKGVVSRNVWQLIMVQNCIELQYWSTISISHWSPHGRAWMSTEMIWSWALSHKNNWCIAETIWHWDVSLDQSSRSWCLVVQSDDYRGEKDSHSLKEDSFRTQIELWYLPTLTNLLLYCSLL